MVKTIEDKSIDLIFADPPYNINKADWDNFESQEAYIEWSLKWIKEAAKSSKVKRIIVRLWFFREFS